MSGLDLWHFLLPVRVMAYGAAGAVGTRLSLRLFSFFAAHRFFHHSGEESRRENEEVCLTQQRHCERSEAIQFLFLAMDCFACARNDDLGSVGCLKIETDTDGDQAKFLSSPGVSR